MKTTSSTCLTLKRAPTIIEAIDEYVKENGALDTPNSEEQKHIFPTDSFLVGANFDHDLSSIQPKEKNDFEISL